MWMPSSPTQMAWKHSQASFDHSLLGLSWIRMFCNIREPWVYDSGRGIQSQLHCSHPNRPRWTDTPRTAWWRLPKFRFLTLCQTQRVLWYIFTLQTLCTSALELLCKQGAESEEGEHFAYQHVIDPAHLCHNEEELWSYSWWGKLAGAVLNCLLQCHYWVWAILYSRTTLILTDAAETHGPWTCIIVVLRGWDVGGCM